MVVLCQSLSSRVIFLAEYGGPPPPPQKKKLYKKKKKTEMLNI
jgi:hypothetical protein